MVNSNFYIGVDMDGNGGNCSITVLGGAIHGGCLNNIKRFSIFGEA